MEHPPNKHQTRYLHQKNTSNITVLDAQITEQNHAHEQSIQYASPEASDPTAIGPEESNSAEAWAKDFEIACATMYKDLNEDLKKCLDEARENTHSWTK